MKIEMCQNCGRTIGKLEQAYVFHENVVCQDCYAKLTDVEDKQAQSSIKRPIEIKAKTVTQKELPTKTSLLFATRKNEVRTNIKQGALLGGCVCFLLGLILMFLSLWSFILYVPFFLVAFILSIVAMAQARVAGGVLLLVVTIIIPPILFTFKVTEAFSKRFDDARSSSLNSISQENNRSINNSFPSTIVRQSAKPEQGVQATSVPIIGLGDSVVIDEIKISVLRARLGFIERKSIFGDSKRRSDSKYLLVELTLQNISTGKIVYLQNIWEKSKLIDNYNNIEGSKFTDSFLADDIIGNIGSTKIRPGEVMQDIMIFEPPIDTATDFTIESDPGFWKSISEDRVRELSDSSFCIRFTRNQIQRN